MARLAATGEHKARAARQMRATAALLDARHPEMMAGDHLRDAARVLEHGSTEGAKRHLDAAMFMLTPQSLIRHGIRDDDGHADAKHLMHTANRHRLAVQDIEDIHGRNERLREIARARLRGEAAPEPDQDQPGQIAAANSSPAILLSARTAMLEVTPAPRGRPGGPGLYRVKGMGHTPYLQQVVKALIEKRGMPPGKAYAIARARIRKWLATSKHPEVRAAAARAEAGELARQARAHAHTAQPWEVADALIELACTPTVLEFFNPYHGPGGQFTTQQGAQQGKGKQKQQAAKDRRADRPQRRELVHKIASLKLQLASLQAQLRAATSHRTAASGKSRSSTPAKTGAGATSAKAAAAGKAGATSAARTASTAARKSTSAAALRSQIAAVRATLAADIAQLRHL